jgi:GWxTD domain-containing protein
MTTAEKWLVAGVLTLSGCGQSLSRQPPNPGGVGSYNVEAVEAGEVRDFRNVYRQMGIVSSPPPISFVVQPAFFATPSPDTTLAILSISLPNRGITFTHDGPMFRAEYSVDLIVRHNGTEVRRVTTLDTVRVATLKETNRTDESVIFRQAVRVPPGQYTIAYDIHDILGNREAAVDGAAIIPRFATSALSLPVVVYEGAARKKLSDIPQYLPTPRSAVIFGADAAVPVYIEAYGAQITTPLALSLRDPKGAVVWHDTAWLAQRNGLASGIVKIPLARADIGIFTVMATHQGNNKTDTVQTRVFIGFGADLPVVSFEDMVSYLRYFASNSRLRALENAKGETRGAVWSTFLRSTDPTPETPQNEALQDYFRRIRDANVQFRTDGPDGWLSDRGSVYVALGEPDAMQEREGYWSGYSLSMSARTRFQIWEYRDLQTNIIFYDETGGGQWKMIPSSESNFRSQLARRIRR